MKRSTRSAEVDIRGNLSNLRVKLYKSMMENPELSMEEIVNELTSLYSTAFMASMDLNHYVKVNACSFRDDLTDSFITNYGRSTKKFLDIELFYLAVACYLNHLVIDSRDLENISMQGHSICQVMNEKLVDASKKYERERGLISYDKLSHTVFICKIVMNLFQMETENLKYALKLLKI